MNALARTSCGSLFLALGLSTAPGCDPVPEPTASFEGHTDYRSNCGRAICGLRLNTDEFVGTAEFYEFSTQPISHTNTEGHTIEFVGAFVPDGQEEVFVPPGEDIFVSNDGDFVINANGTSYSGSTMVDVVLQFYVDDELRTLQFVEHRDVEGASHSFLIHELLWDGTSQPICAADSNAIDGGEHYAFLYDDMHLVTQEEGSHFPGQTFAVEGMVHIACASGATGKAANFGYRPYNFGDGMLDSIVRAIRADYCGDGTSYTAEGENFGVYFDGMNEPPQGTTEVFEGVFDANGAVCLSQTRISDMQYGCQIEECMPWHYDMADQQSDVFLVYIGYENI